MLVLALPLLATSAAMLPGTRVPAGRVMLADRSIRLADVLRSAPGKQRARVIARIPTGRNRATLSSAAIASLMRRALPGISVAGLRDDGMTFVLAAATRRGSGNMAKLKLYSDADVHEGDEMRLVSTVGSVRIVRDVIALQSSRGRRVFVRDADGQVFSVRRAELQK